jgi:hypothetical protein
MTIKHFFDKSIVVERLKSLGGNKRGYSCTATVDVHIQNVDIAERIELDIIDAMAWTMYYDPEDFLVKIGDKLTDSDGKIYKVSDIVDKDYSFGINKHSQATLLEYSE